LFTEVKLIEFRLHVCWANSALPINGYAAFTPSLASTASPPGTGGAVWDNAEAKLVNPQFIKSSNGMNVFTVKPRTGLEFASTTTPNPGSYAGIPGSIGYYGAGFPASASVATIFLEVFLMFRNRS
jgi:hypothetical protein